MKAAPAKESIEVGDLRVGMFVHLDIGWMSHPFPLGSFKIASTEQVATIRALGVPRVRWSPTQSDALEVPLPLPLPQPLPASTRPDDVNVSAPAIAHRAPAESPENQARKAHRRRLADQRAAQRVCEHQFAEAALDCQRLTDLVRAKPAEARTRAERLSNALVDKMLGAPEPCIRLLSEAAGDKASMHALNVTIVALLMGRSLGLAGAELLDLGVGAMLHDIGKLDLPDRLCHREDHFSAAEQRGYEEHVALGIAHARRMGLSPGAMLVLAQHHEHADGSGFPLHLNGDPMTLGARIVSLVNRYDNLCNPHVASRALTPHESLSLLFAQDKRQFDTAILSGFIRMMGVYPAGSTVQLTDDRFAMVVGVNSARPLKPRVLVHEARVPHDEALIVDLEASPGLGIRRSIRPVQLPPAALAYLAPRPRVAYFFEPVTRASEEAVAA